AMAAPGRLLVPARCLCVVLRNDDALVIGAAKLELCPGMFPLSGFAVPSDGFGFVLSHAPPLLIQTADEVLRLRLAGFRKWPQNTERRGIVAPLIGRDAVAEALFRRRGSDRSQPASKHAAL